MFVFGKLLRFGCVSFSNVKYLTSYNNSNVIVHRERPKSNQYLQTMLKLDLWKMFTRCETPT